MTEYERLIAHLKNLQSKNIKQVTFDVNWLAKTLAVSPPVPTSSKAVVPGVVTTQLNLDGGTFSED